MSNKHKEIKKNLDYAIKDGAAHSVMLGFGESFLSPYAIALGATNMQVGLLKSIPHLIGSFSQLFSSTISEILKNRKKLITTGALFQALMWIPILFVFLLAQDKIWFLILFVTIYLVLGSVISPVWSSWIGDIVPDKIKGTYFGKRNRMTKLSAFLSMTLAGLLLQFFSGFNPIYGFMTIFSIAMVARLVSWIYLHRMTEYEYLVPEESKFSFIDFVKKIRTTNYGIFVIYLCLMSFSVQISSPYSVVYLLRDLKFDYMTYTIIIGSSVVSSFFFMAIWGKYADVFGNKKILTLTGLLIPFVPLLWLVSKDIGYLILVKAFSGFAWSGFHLASFNFVFDTVSRPKRVRCVSYYNILNGVAVFLGASLGGFLIRFGTMFWSKIYIVFIVSGMFRLLTSLIMLQRIKEVKRVKKISEGKLVWSLLTTEVLEGLTHPVVVLMSKRRVAKKQGERILEWVEKQIGIILGKRHKYS